MLEVRNRVWKNERLILILLQACVTLEEVEENPRISVVKSSENGEKKRRCPAPFRQGPFQIWWSASNKPPPSRFHLHKVARMRNPTSSTVLYKILTPQEKADMPGTNWAGTALDVSDPMF